MPDEKLLAEMGKYNEELAKAGVMLDGEGLQPSSKGARVKFSGNERTVIDGPFAETKELIAGYWLIQVKSKEEAIEWVKRCPNPDGGRVGDRDSPGLRGGGLRPVKRYIRARELQKELAEQEAAVTHLGLRTRSEDGVIGSRDGYRCPSRDRGGLADRVAEAHRRADADRPRRRPGRGSRAGRARRGARAVAGVRRPAQPGRLADGHRQAPRDRPLPPEQAARAQARGARPRARGPAGDEPRRISTRRSTTTSATTCCA